MDISTPHHPFGLPRLSTLAACVAVALGSGTNYVFSAYAPQLGEQLGLTHVQLNVIGIAGNIGVFSSAPFWGRTVDSRGPKPLFATAFVLLLGGYSGIRHFYNAGVSSIHSSMPAPSYFWLAMCNFMTGVAGTAGIMGSVNTTAKTFPDEARASTTGLVLSGFGLSAFLFSAIAGLAFPGDTSSLLILLTIGTATPMIMGYFFVRPIPLPANHDHSRIPSDLESSASGPVPNNVAFHRCSGNDRTPLLAGQDSSSSGSRDLDVESSVTHRTLGYPTVTLDSLTRPATARSEDPLSDSSTDPGRIVLERRGTGCEAHVPELNSSPTATVEEPNIYGWELWKTTEFLLLFSIFGLLTGTGLMYINNVGSISQALIAQDDPDYDVTLAARIQAKQVTIVSLMNCAGRIVFGLISDFTKTRLHQPRSYCFVLTSVLFLIVQIILKNFITDVHSLSWGSAILGFVYGGSFSLLPTLAIGYFGFAHFSENFGFITLSPIVTGYIFSQVFGRMLDAHEAPPTPDNYLLPRSLTQGPHNIPSLNLPPQVHRCLDGSACYADAFNVTITACLAALLLSLWISWRDRMNMEEVRDRSGRYGIASKPTQPTENR